MSVTYPIGYPTADPMDNPKGCPNRGRIARPVSYRPVSSPLLLWSPSTTSFGYVPREAADGLVATQ